MTNVVNKRPPGCLMGGGCLVILGVAFAGFFTLGFIGLMIDEEKSPLGMWFFMVFLILLGIFCAYLGFRRRKEVLMQTNLIDIISNQGHTSIQSIGMLLGGTDLQDTTKKIQTVINKGYLPGYIVDPLTNRVTRYDPENPLPPPKPWRMTFECRSCGAKNRVMTIDGTASCEYCGTPYVAPKDNS